MNHAQRNQHLIAALDETIREHENFIADPAHYTIEPAEKRLNQLRAVRERLAHWVKPISCRCSRGGNAYTCECRDWPDEQARRILRGDKEVEQ